MNGFTYQEKLHKLGKKKLPFQKNCLFVLSENMN